MQRELLGDCCNGLSLGREHLDGSFVIFSPSHLALVRRELVCWPDATRCLRCLAIPKYEAGGKYVASLLVDSRHNLWNLWVNSLSGVHLISFSSSYWLLSRASEKSFPYVSTRQCMSYDLTSHRLATLSFVTSKIFRPT